MPILGHQLFAFTDPNAHLETNNSLLKGKSYRKAVLNKQCYTTLKESSDNNQEYLSTEHLTLTSEWFCCNSNSKVTEMFDVVWSDFVKILNDFYNSMINMKECFDDERAAWNIHQFFMDQLSLLNNCFIFFEQNKGGIYWISSCLCNPWFYVLLNIKEHCLQIAYQNL